MTKAIAYNIGYANALADQASSESFKNAYNNDYSQAPSPPDKQERNEKQNMYQTNNKRSC